MSNSIHLTINNFLYPRLEGTIFSWALSSVAVCDKVSEVFLIFLGQRDEKKSWYISPPNFLWSAWQSSTTISSLDLARTECKATHCSGRAMLKPGLERTRESNETRDPDTSWHCLQLETFCCNSMLDYWYTLHCSYFVLTIFTIQHDSLIVTQVSLTIVSASIAAEPLFSSIIDSKTKTSF